MTPNGDKVWEYINPQTGEEQGGFAAGVYRAWRYEIDYPGLAGKDLTPGDPIEKYPNYHYVDIKPGSCQIGGARNRGDPSCIPSLDARGHFGCP